MASPEQARRYAELLIDPRVQSGSYPEGQTPERNVAFLANAFEDIPAAVLELLVQTEQKIAPLGPDQSIFKFSPEFEDFLTTGLGMDVDERREHLRDLGGLHVSGLGQPGRTYIPKQHPGFLAHELGHAIDVVLGDLVEGPDGVRLAPHSEIEPLTRSAYLGREELLNAYSHEAPAEAFAEWFRASLGIRSPEWDDPGAHVRADAETRAPTMIFYMDNLIRSIELAFEIDPQAFGAEGTLDIDLFVIARASLSTVLHLSAADIDMDELRSIRDEFQVELELDRTDEPPIGPPRFDGAMRIPAAELELAIVPSRGQSIVSEDDGLEL